MSGLPDPNTKEISTAGFATLLALLKALAASKVGPDENASLDPAQRTILGKA